MGMYSGASWERAVDVRRDHIEGVCEEDQLDRGRIDTGHEGRPQQLGKYSADGLPVKRTIKHLVWVEQKVLAPFAQPTQTGHLMC